MKFHRRTKGEYWHIVWQSSLVFFIMFLVMCALKHATHTDIALGAIGTTSLGSSAFLAFVAHNTKMASARKMISGYLLGLLIGVVGSYFLKLFFSCTNFHCQIENINIFVAAAAAMVTMVMMTLLSSEHPPAVGIAIGLVLRSWNIPTLLVVIATVVLIALLKFLLRRWLINLL